MASNTRSATRLHPGYVESLLRAAESGQSPTEAVRAVTLASTEAFERFFRAHMRSARNFKIMVQEVMMLPRSIVDNVRAAYPEDEVPQIDVREHVIELIESTDDDTKLALN